MRYRRTAFFLAALALAGMASAQVKVDWDRTADFTKYATYEFQEGTPALNPEVEERIRKVVTAELTGKGLKPPEEGAAPDLYVRTHVSAGKEKRYDHDELSVRSWDGRGWETATPTVYEVQTGTLAVELVDAGSKMTVWNGSSTILAPELGNPGKMEAVAGKAASKMFKKYPPPASKKKK